MHERATFKAQLAIAAARLKSARLEQPAREARHLMQLACKMSAADLISAENELMSDVQTAAFFDLVERRAVGEPFEHLSGEAYFYGLDFHVTQNTLIPRADSEVVVDEALARLPLGREATIADLGTGTGCLLIAILKSQPGVTGTGVDLSPDAAEVARRNVDMHGLGQQARIEVGSWTDWQGWGDVDLIISNPPYIASGIIPTLDASVRRFEPHLALDGGEDGLSAYRSIVELASRHMKAGAWLVFEIGYDQREAITALLRETGFGSISCGQDHGGRDRVICARR